MSPKNVYLQPLDVSLIRAYMKKLLHADILTRRLTSRQALAAERHPVSFVLFNIRSMYNVGSIFRTADAMLARELVMCGYTPYPPRKEISKTALGAEQSVPWRYENDAVEALRDLRRSGITTLALELTDTGRSYRDLRVEEYPIAIVLGNEITGIDDRILAECDGAIEIPMHGVKHSLNVAVAAGIVAYDAIDRWRSRNAGSAISR